MLSIAVGTIGDIGRALGEGMLPYCDNLMNMLMMNVSSNAVSRGVKPIILSTFGDLALAIGGNFEKYLAPVLQTLMGAIQITVTQPAYDLDILDFHCQLREAVLEAYVGIVQALKSAQKTYLLGEHLANIFQFMQTCYSDPERTEAVGRTMAGLLGDLAEAFPPGQLRVFYQAPWIEKLIKELRQTRHASASSKEVARWAREMVKLQA